MDKISKKDLRLGNMFEQGIVFKISGRAGAKVHLHGKGKWYKGFRKEVSVEELKPIVLTPQILTEWCGFEKATSDLWIKNSIEIWYRDSGFYHTEMNVGLNLNGLHELQNLYKVLTGEELEIKE